MSPRRVTAEVYLKPDVFHALAERIADLPLDPFEGRITAEQVRRVLEQYGNIRPGYGRNPFQS